MISRSTALILAELYQNHFTGSSSSSSIVKLRKDRFYDYLYEQNYEAWFCNLAKTPTYAREFKEFIMQLHTGESLVASTKEWGWDKRKALGQTYLVYLAQDLIKWYLAQEANSHTAYYSKYRHQLVRALELDGYIFRDNTLYFSEADVLNVREEQGVLQQLYHDLNLADTKITFEFLQLSDQHYKEGRWADCIANARKFLESILQNIAVSYSKHYLGQPISETILSKPVEIREFLMNEKLLEKKEKEALDKIYGLLSHTGSHPYMAEKDQARLLRQVGLIFAQFIMLRYEGKRKI